MKGSTGPELGPYFGKVSPAGEGSVPQEGLNAGLEAPDLGLTAREETAPVVGFSKSLFRAVEEKVRAGSGAAAAYMNRGGDAFSELKTAAGNCSDTLAFEPPSSSMDEIEGTGKEGRGVFAKPSFPAVGEESLRGSRSNDVGGNENGDKLKFAAAIRGRILEGSRLTYVAVSSGLDAGGGKAMEEVPGGFVQGGSRDPGNAERDDFSKSLGLGVEHYSAGDDLEQCCAGNADDAVEVSCSVEADLVAADLRSDVVERKMAEEVFESLVWQEEEDDQSMDLVESMEHSFSTIDGDGMYGTGKTPAGNENREGTDYLVGLEDQNVEGNLLGNPDFEVPHFKLNEGRGKGMEGVPENFGLESVEDKIVEQDGVLNEERGKEMEGVAENFGLENVRDKNVEQDGVLNEEGGKEMEGSPENFGLESVRGKNVDQEGELNEEGGKEMEGVPENFGLESVRGKNVEQDGVSNFSCPVIGDNIQDSLEQASVGIENREEHSLLAKWQDDCVEGSSPMNTVCGSPDLSLVDRGIKGMEVLCGNTILENGQDKNAVRNESVNLSFPAVREHTEDYSEHNSVENINREESDFCIRLQDAGASVQEPTESMLASREETGTIGINLHSTAVGVVEKNSAHDLGIGYDFVEQGGALKGMKFDLMETKEPAMDAECRLAVVDQVGFRNISETAKDQRQENDTSAKRVHPAASNVPESQHLPPVEGGSGGGPIDAGGHVNESSIEVSTALISQVQLCNVLDKPLVEAPGASKEAGQESSWEALILPDEVKLTEQIQGDPQTEYGRKSSEEPPSMEISEAAEFGFLQKPITGLVTAVQSRDEVSATIEEEGTPQVSASMKTVKGISDVVVSGTDKYRNLKKESMGPVAFNEPPTCRDFGDQPNDGLQFEEPFNIQEREDKNMQGGFSTSPISQIRRKDRRRKSSNSGSTREQLGVHKGGPKEHQFSVGDLVWGKVRSHPWWPGQIFDPSDSSEIANKHSKKNHMLVAYFGDATFGWCDESQLIPFQANFEEKVKQTAAKAFRNAVKNALGEIARRVELGLTCFCQSEEARSRLESKAIVNTGIRNGVIVNDHMDVSHAVNAFHPSEFLSTIQSLARSPLMDHTLDVTVASAQASAILTFKGLLLSGKISAEALGKQTVPEDMAGFTSPVPTQGGHTNPDIGSRNKFVKSGSSSSGKHRRKSERMQSRSPKKRRICDLIAGDGASHEAGEDMDGYDETLLEIAGSKAKFLKKLFKIPQKTLKIESGSNKRSSEAANAVDQLLKKARSDGVVKTKEEKESLLRKVTPLKSAKTKEGGYLPRELVLLKNNKRQNLETISALDIVVNNPRTMQAKRSLTSLSHGVDQDAKRTPKSFKFGECIMKAASELTSTSPGMKCREDRAGFSPIKVVPSKTVKTKEEEGHLSRKVTPMKTNKHQKSDTIFSSDVIINGSRSMQAKRDLVSPCSGDDQHAKKTPKSFKFGECILKVASELTSTPPVTKGTSTPPVTKGMDAKVGQKTQESGKKLAVNADKTISGSPSNKLHATWPFRENGSTHELLLELLIVARHPLYWVGERKMPSRLINSFLEFRNAVFQKSPGYGFYDSDVAKASALKFLNQSHKLKSPKSSSKLPGYSNTENSKERDWTDDASFSRPRSHGVHEKLKRKPEFPVERARKKSKHAVRLPNPPWSSKVSKQKQEEKIGDRYAKHYSRRTMLPQLPVKSSRELPDDGNANQNPASLFMRFPKGFALPSETELKAKFTRFGPLEISETKVFRRSGCAQVVFKRCSDAEAAFNFVSENNVFGSASVSFRLRFLSSGTLTNTVQKLDHGKYDSSIPLEVRQARQVPLLKDTPRDVEGQRESMVQLSGSIVPFVEKVGPSRPNTLGEPPLLFIQQNLEMMTSMLSRSAECTSTSAMSKSDNSAPDSKADIMDEMMCLLQKVSALVGSPP